MLHHNKTKLILILVTLSFALVFGNPVSAAQEHIDRGNTITIKSSGPESSGSSIWEVFLNWWKQHH